MSKLLIDESPLIVLPSLVALVGLERAIVLQQIHFLLSIPRSGIERDGHKWIWNTAQQWHDDHFNFWAVDSIKKFLISLEKDGYIISAQFDKEKFNRRKYYRVNYDKLDNPSYDGASKAPSDGASKAPSLTDTLSLTVRGTDTHAENTTENTLTAKADGEKPAVNTVFPMMDALATVCVVDIKLQRGALAKNGKSLMQAGYCPDQIRALYGQGGWWYSTYWKGQRNTPPTIGDINSTIAQAVKVAAPAQMDDGMVLTPSGKYIPDPNRRQHV